MSTTQPDGFLALPADPNGGSVLVLHAWWGLNDAIKTLCNRLADAGYVAFAPDLYHGRVADTIEGAKSLSGALDADAATMDVANAVQFLSEQHDGAGRGLAIIGFSLGVWFGVEASTAFPERIRAVVIFYGAAPIDYSRSQAAYLGHFAENDPYEPKEYVDETEANLRDAGLPYTFHTYPDTTHWFFESDRADAYNRDAAELAWERTLAFLNETVGQHA
jgi:carboxymethylenebutenolidase